MKANVAPPSYTFEEFLSYVCVERDGDEGGIIPFEMWPHLRERAQSWQAHNSERTTVLTDAMSAKLGLHPSSAAVTQAWVSDLGTNACRAQLQALPKARSATSHPHG